MYPSLQTRHNKSKRFFLTALPGKKIPGPLTFLLQKKYNLIYVIAVDNSIKLFRVFIYQKKSHKMCDTFCVIFISLDYAKPGKPLFNFRL